jgi:hypothetical protein
VSNVNYVSQKFFVHCDDRKTHVFDGYIAEGTGLGYYVNPPVEGAAPEYLHTRNGIINGNAASWYVIVHVEACRRLSLYISVDEDACRSALEEIAGLTDWTANTETIKEITGLEAKITAIFENKGNKAVGGAR